MIELRGRKIALIGGAGFIGHNLAVTLARLGADVHVVDSLQVNNLGAFSNSSCIEPPHNLFPLVQIGMAKDDADTIVTR